MPRRANCRAAVRPAAPAPMMATLSCWGEPLAVLPIRVAAVIFVSVLKADAKENVKRSNKEVIGRRSKERRVGKQVEPIMCVRLLSLEE